MKICPNCFVQVNDEEVCPICGYLLTKEQPVNCLKAGSVLAGRYVVGRVLGQGGFGITYLGWDRKLETHVAIKEYYPNGVVYRTITVSQDIIPTNKSVLEDLIHGKERFLKEARVLARLRDNQGVVDVLDYFEENETAYIIMEYLNGEDLSTKLQSHTYSPEEIMRLMSPVMDALAEIHEQGMVHRDISPENIRVLENGSIRLLDFGAAKVSSGNKEATATVILKAGYAPIEQYALHHSLTAAADIYSLCATIYKCITGVTPPEALERGWNDQIRWPSELGIEIPERLEEALKTGMSVRAEQRFKSIADMRAFLKGEDKPEEEREDSFSGEPEDGRSEEKTISTERADGEGNSGDRVPKGIVRSLTRGLFILVGIIVGVLLTMQYIEKRYQKELAVRESEMAELLQNQQGEVDQQAAEDWQDSSHAQTPQVTQAAGGSQSTNWGLIQDNYVARYSVNGDPYQLGCNLKAFLDNGWELDNADLPLADCLTPHEFSLCIIRQSDRRLQLGLQNPTDHDVTVEEAVVVHVLASPFHGFPMDSVKLEGVELYQTDVRSFEKQTGVHPYSEEGDRLLYVFRTSDQEPKVFGENIVDVHCVDGCLVKYVLSDSGLVSVSIDCCMERPINNFLKDDCYSLKDSFHSLTLGEMELADDIMKGDLTIRDFINGGWELLPDEEQGWYEDDNPTETKWDDIVESYSRIFMIARRNGVDIYITAINPYLKKCSYKDCAIENLHIPVPDQKVTLNSVDISMTKPEALADCVSTLSPQMTAEYLQATKDMIAVPLNNHVLVGSYGGYGGFNIYSLVNHQTYLEIAICINGAPPYHAKMTRKYSIETIAIDGSTFQYPGTVGDFVNNGWTLQGRTESNDGTYTDIDVSDSEALGYALSRKVKMRKGNCYLDLFFDNTEDNPDQATVAYMTVMKDNTENTGKASITDMSINGIELMKNGEVCNTGKFSEFAEEDGSNIVLTFDNSKVYINLIEGNGVSEFIEIRKNVE